MAPKPTFAYPADMSQSFDEPELFSNLEHAVGVLRRAVIGLEPQYLSIEQVKDLVRLFSDAGLCGR
jgi:hypothetical protein